MQIKIQATGSMPLSIATNAAFSNVNKVDPHRVITATLYQADGIYHDHKLEGVYYHLHMTSEWENERTISFVGGPYRMGDMELLSEAVSTDAKCLLRPGAGYPATPDFEARQSKLGGQMYTLAMDCLTRSMADLSQTL